MHMARPDGFGTSGWKRFSHALARGYVPFLPTIAQNEKSWKGMSKFDSDFQEIAPCGGKCVIEIIEEDGALKYSSGFSISNHYPASIFLLYALMDEGIPVATIPSVGLGTAFPTPPFMSCVAIFMPSDQHGMFGHFCHHCEGYWRAQCAPGYWKMICPYCGVIADTHHFRTRGQLAYIKHFCDLIKDGLNRGSGKYEIDFDQAAEQARNDVPLPGFYFMEESQQHRFVCRACNTTNDIIGELGHCTNCYSLNHLDVFKHFIEKERIHLNNGTDNSICLRNVISKFDYLMRDFVRLLKKDIPVSSRRMSILEKFSALDIDKTSKSICDIYDINIYRGIRAQDISKIERLFHRRHLHEHKGGVVDAKYMKDSGDESVRKGQKVYETKEDLHFLMSLTNRLIENMRDGYHDLFPQNKDALRV